METTETLQTVGQEFFPFAARRPRIYKYKNQYSRIRP